MSLYDVQEFARHTDPRTTIRNDPARHSLDRHATYTAMQSVAGAICRGNANGRPMSRQPEAVRPISGDAEDHGRSRLPILTAPHPHGTSAAIAC